MSAHIFGQSLKDLADKKQEEQEEEAKAALT